MNLVAPRPPELRDVQLLREPDDREIELFTKPDAYQLARCTCCRRCWTKVARLHLKKVGAVLTELTDAQAAYIGVPKRRPVPGWTLCR